MSDRPRLSPLDLDHILYQIGLHVDAAPWTGRPAYHANPPNVTLLNCLRVCRHWRTALSCLLDKRLSKAYLPSDRLLPYKSQHWTYSWAWGLANSPKVPNLLHISSFTFLDWETKAPRCDPIFEEYHDHIGSLSLYISHPKMIFPSTTKIISRMPHLETLAIYGRGMGAGDYEFHFPFDLILHCIPGLKTLILHNFKSGALWSATNVPPCGSSSITKIDLGKICHPFQDTIELLRYCPQLTTLTFDARPQGIRSWKILSNRLAAFICLFTPHLAHLVDIRAHPSQSTSWHSQQLRLEREFSFESGFAAILRACPRDRLETFAVHKKCLMQWTPELQESILLHRESLVTIRTPSVHEMGCVQSPLFMQEILEYWLQEHEQMGGEEPLSMPMQLLFNCTSLKVLEMATGRRPFVKPSHPFFVDERPWACQDSLEVLSLSGVTPRMMRAFKTARARQQTAGECAGSAAIPATAKMSRSAILKRAREDVLAARFAACPQLRVVHVAGPIPLGI